MNDLTIRTTYVKDVPSVAELLDFQVKPFEHENVEDKLKDSVFAIGLFKNNKLVAHASFSDHFVLENIISSTSDWVPWIAKAVCRERFKCFNTLFLQSYVCKPEYEENLKTILVKAFREVPLVEYFLFICRKACNVDVYILSLFRQKCLSEFEYFSLWVCKRKLLIPIRIRDVKLEDYKDILRLTKGQSLLLKEVYGERYGIDIALLRNKSVFSSLALIDEKPVGFFYASSVGIDIENLNVNHQLDAFHGLKKQPSVLGIGKTPKRVKIKMAKDEKDEKGDDTGEPIMQLSRLCSRQSAYVSGYLNRQAWNKMRNMYGFHPTDDPYKYTIKKEEDRDVEEGSMTFKLDQTKQPNYPMKHNLPVIPQFQRPEIPKYEGCSDCFEVFFFAMEKQYESEFMCFLKAAFRKFANLEYCVLTMKCGRTGLSLYRYFYKVPPRPLSCFPQTLFVFHKAGVMTDFHARLCTKADFPGIKHMLEGLCSKNYVLWDVKNILLSTDDTINKPTAVVAICHHSVVGIAIIKPAVKYEYLSSHYHLDGDVSFSSVEHHGKLCHYILNPALKLMSKCFLREAMRLSRKSSLSYHIYPPHVSLGDSLWQSGCNVLDDLLPLEPVRPITYSLTKLSEFQPSKEIYETEQNFSTYFMSKRLIVSPKVIDTTRIVIVGASEVALSFLETLIYSSNILFDSLFIVSPIGLPGEYSFDNYRSIFLPHNVYFNVATLGSLCLQTRVNVIYGKMASIKRAEKRIKLDNGAELAYDYLILTCGLQYQRSLETIINIGKIHEKHTEGNEPNIEEDNYMRLNRHTCLRISEKTLIKTADNLFAINDIYDAAVALKWLGEKFTITPGQIIVYGNSIEAYTCLVGILNANITGDNITFAKTAPDERYPVFKIKALENAVTSLLEDVGITVYNETILDIPHTGKTILKVNVSATNVKRPLDCRALFLCNEKKVDYVTYNALLRAMIHFDGRLSIDPTFKTNGERIYGAGSHTKFHAKYFANHYNNTRFNSTEVGKRLAESILRVLSHEAIEDDCTKLPQFSEPTIVYAELPQGYHYLLIDKPRYDYEEIEVSENQKPETFFKSRKIVISNITRNIRTRVEKDYIEAYRNEIEDDDIYTFFTKPDERKPKNEYVDEFYKEPNFEEYLKTYDKFKQTSKAFWYRRNPTKWENDQNADEHNEYTEEGSKENGDDITEKDILANDFKILLKDYHLKENLPYFNTPTDVENLEENICEPCLHEDSSSESSEVGKSKPASPAVKTITVNENKYEHFSMEFNEFCEVETITCFSKTKLPALNFAKLYGLHYSYFISLFEKIQNMNPSDVFDFFQQRWLDSIYHDSFKQFRSELRKCTPKINSVNISRKEFYKLHEKYRYENIIKFKLGQFVNENLKTLPSYHL